MPHSLHMSPTRTHWLLMYLSQKLSVTQVLLLLHAAATSTCQLLVSRD